MKTWILLSAALVLAAPLGAKDFTRLTGPKDPVVPAPSAATPSGDRVGGDTIETALAFSTVPYADAGTTDGFTNDYDEACPYGDSASPDVVYAFTPEASGTYRFDLCGSSYDTKLYIYDASRAVIACDDDHYPVDDDCGAYTSMLTDVFLVAGATVYVVIDGYDGDSGEYQFAADTSVPCTFACPPEAVSEGEPPFDPAVPDAFNCGCQCEGPPTYSSLVADQDGAALVCLSQGWRAFDRPDTDWMSFMVGAAGVVHFDVASEYALRLYVVTGNEDCVFLQIAAEMQVPDCGSLVQDVALEPGSTAVLYVEPYALGPDAGRVPEEYAASLAMTGLAVPQAVEPTSWGAIKGTYR